MSGAKAPTGATLQMRDWRRAQQGVVPACPDELTDSPFPNFPRLFGFGSERTRRTQFEFCYQKSRSVFACVERLMKVSRCQLPNPPLWSSIRSCMTNHSRLQKVAPGRLAPVLHTAQADLGPFRDLDPASGTRPVRTATFPQRRPVIEFSSHCACSEFGQFLNGFFHIRLSPRRVKLVLHQGIPASPALEGESAATRRRVHPRLLGSLQRLGFPI